MQLRTLPELYCWYDSPRGSQGPSRDPQADARGTRARTGFRGGVRARRPGRTGPSRGRRRHRRPQGPLPVQRPRGVSARGPCSRTWLTVCLDSWAVLAWLDGDEPAARVVQRELGKERPVMSWLNLGEVAYQVERRHGL